MNAPSLLLTCTGLLLALPLTASGQIATYERLDDIPPSVGEKLPCTIQSDECATRVRLKQEVMLWGVPLQAGSIASDAEEDRNGILARDFQYQGVWLKGGEKVSFYASWSGTLRNDQTFDGVPCRGGTEALFEQGRLVECTLAAAHRTQGIEFRGGTRLTFTNDDNSLAWATLTQPHDIGGQRYPGGISLRFDGKGKVIDKQPPIYGASSSNDR